MPAATKEFVLNYAMNRWQLNFKKNVGPTSDSIRKCAPKSVEEWREYYYKNVRSREHIDSLADILYKRKICRTRDGSIPSYWHRLLILIVSRICAQS